MKQVKNINGFLFIPNGHDEKVIANLNEACEGLIMDDILVAINRYFDDGELAMLAQVVNQFKDETEAQSIKPKLDNPEPELMEMWIGDISFPSDSEAIVHNIKEIKMVTADYEEPEKDSYLVPAEYNGKILVDNKALIKDRIYRDSSTEKYEASLLKFSHLNKDLSPYFLFAGGVDCYLRTNGDFIGFPAYANGWVYNHQDNIQ